MVCGHAGQVLGGHYEGGGLLMKWFPLKSGIPYTCKDCPGLPFIESLINEMNRWKDLASEYYHLDPKCECPLCDRFREAMSNG